MTEDRITYCERAPQYKERAKIIKDIKIAVVIHHFVNASRRTDFKAGFQKPTLRIVSGTDCEDGRHLLYGAGGPPCCSSSGRFSSPCDDPGSVPSRGRSIFFGSSFEVVASLLPSTLLSFWSSNSCSTHLPSDDMDMGFGWDISVVEFSSLGLKH